VQGGAPTTTVRSCTVCLVLLLIRHNKAPGNHQARHLCLNEQEDEDVNG